MKLAKKICCLSAIVLSLAIVSCSNPSDTPSNSGSNGTGTQTTTTTTTTPTTTPTTTTPTTTTPTTTTSTTTTPTTSEGGSSTTIPSTPETPEPQYKWIMTHLETESQGDSYTSSSSTNYTYSFYNSDFDCSNTSISVSNTSISVNGNTTSTSSNTKSVSTYSKTGNNITRVANNYTRNGNSWDLTSETSTVYYRYYSLMSSNYNKTYPSGTETTTNYTVELLDESNGIERYKVIYPAEYGIYCIYEFANNKIQKQINYFSATNKKNSETDYTYSDNNILVENNIELALTQTKTYDNNEQIISQLNTTLGNVTLNANNTITVVLGNSTNTATNYSYTTEVFTKMQVPFSQQ